MHVVGVNVCRGDGQAPLPTGRLLYTERLQRKMGVRSGSLRTWRSALGSPIAGYATSHFGTSRSVRPGAPVRLQSEVKRPRRGPGQTGAIDPIRPFSLPP